MKINTLPTRLLLYFSFIIKYIVLLIFILFSSDFDISYFSNNIRLTQFNSS